MESELLSILFRGILVLSFGTIGSMLIIIPCIELKREAIDEEFGPGGCIAMGIIFVAFAVLLGLTLFI